jgi:hypothetical protein
MMTREVSLVAVVRRLTLSVVVVVVVGRVVTVLKPTEDGTVKTGAREDCGRLAVDEEVVVGTTIEGKEVGNGPMTGSGLIVSVIVAVSLDKVTVAVRVMGPAAAEEGADWEEELAGAEDEDAEDEGAEDDDAVTEGAVDCEGKLVLAWEDDDAVAPGWTVTVTVFVPGGTVTVMLLVMRLRLVELAAEEGVDCEEPWGLDCDAAPVEEAADAVVGNKVDTVGADASGDEVGTIPAGIVVRIRLASSMFAHPTITPSIVFIGSAKQAEPAAGQGMIWKAPPLAHVPNPPATHAAWPGVQAEPSVKVAKTLFSPCAARRLA